ncbi:MAG: DUF3578 domain-containing protein [Maricaulis sp.]|nr:DUF3578 domain-containing protein [Maricaulis sp.]
MQADNIPKPEGRITRKDIQHLVSSRDGRAYNEFSQGERVSYEDIVAALQTIPGYIIGELQTHTKLAVKQTSGFSLASGVRGRPPKDLWFAIYPEANAKPLVANPQLFCIVSERGVEYGFGAVVHPSDFSNQTTKIAVRDAAKYVFAQLPKSSSATAQFLTDQLTETGSWCFRRKQRLTPGDTDFSDLSEWLDFLHSEKGARQAGGSISRYIRADELDGRDLVAELVEMAALFKPLIDIDWKTPQEFDDNIVEPASHSTEANMADGNEFARRMGSFVTSYSAHRSGPYGLQNELGEAKRELQSWLEQHPAINGRPDLKVDISVGQGNWTKTPWIAVLDRRVTSSTQKGIYIVILVAEDLSVSYLTLNQGMTELRNNLGQQDAVKEMLRVAEATRLGLSNLGTAGFSLDNDINLRSATPASKNYETGTIAHVAMPNDNLPDDETFDRHLQALLRAYNSIVEDRPSSPATVREPEQEPLAEAELYNVEDALVELFCKREDVERYLSIWRMKKNLVLQGAPGVGKSFIAKRLAYTLIGAKDEHRIQTVQFHQSYSYEDFVQGYRPNGESGFERRNGAFVDFRNRAAADLDHDYVFIIDEINRGNLSKIFGELMLLIEGDKRSRDWGARLAYAADDEEKFWVPPNLYILGMMNTADRSLSLVDYALRRRFAFATMEPQFISPKFHELLRSRGVTDAVKSRLVARMNELNNTIADDRVNLGPGFRIGHSFFTPTEPINDPEAWYRQVVETEIYPLLEEYWFDDPKSATDWLDRLLTT